MVSMSPEGLSPGKIVCQNAGGGVVNCEVPCDWRFRPANTFPQQDGETTIQSQRMSKATTRFTFCVLRPCWNDLVLMDEFPLFARFAQKKRTRPSSIYHYFPCALHLFRSLFIGRSCPLMKVGLSLLVAITYSSPFTTLASVPSMDPGRPTASRVTHFIKYIEWTQDRRHVETCLKLKTRLLSHLWNNNGISVCRKQRTSWTWMELSDCKIQNYEYELKYNARRQCLGKQALGKDCLQLNLIQLNFKPTKGFWSRGGKAVSFVFVWWHIRFWHKPVAQCHRGGAWKKGKRNEIMTLVVIALLSLKS